MPSGIMSQARRIQMSIYARLQVWTPSDTWKIETAVTAFNQQTDAQPRHAFAMALMVISSVSISFGGLILRNIDDADVWQINFYRSLALVFTVTLIMLFRYRGQTVQKVRQIGRPGLVAGALLAGAGIAFLQAITNTTVANTLFTLSAIPFLSAFLAWLFLHEMLRRSTLVTMLAAAVVSRKRRLSRQL